MKDATAQKFQKARWGKAMGSVVNTENTGHKPVKCNSACNGARHGI